MGDTSGIGKEGSSIPTPGSSGVGGVSGEPSGASIENALHTPVANLGQLKKVLIDNLGEEEGKKLYNTFVKTFAMQMLSQLQHSADQAKQAAQQMRQGPQG
jgi:hypothetical protein